MTERGSFYRKITYLVLIAVLLFPISQLGAPSTLEDEGGVLAQLRVEHDLGQSNIGEIDPASETMRLATLGLRGIAVSLLWNKANEYKKKEDWTSFRTTLQQLAKLQPYFISFWRYQAWNLSYNVSVELDDVRDRYYYVRRGIEFLKDGIKYNRDSPYLLSELGWFIGSKIGTADEKKEYRRLFKADDDYHPADRPPEQRDNWLVSRSWYEEAISAVDDRQKSMGKKNPVLFYGAPGRSQINYSDAIEREGTFGEKAKKAWSIAANLWRVFGNKEFRASTGILIRLSNLERLEYESKQLEQEIENLIGNPEEQLLAKIRSEMSDRERELSEMTAAEVPEEEKEAYYDILSKLRVTPEQMAEFVSEEHPEKRKEARKLAYRFAENQQKLRLTKSNIDVSNFSYWKVRCAVEQTPEVLRARALAYAAERAFREDADVLESKRMYEESFQLWAQVFEDFPELGIDSPSGSDIMDEVEKYAAVLDQLDQSMMDEEIERKFPLWDLVEANNNGREFREYVANHKRREAEKP